MSYFVSPIGYIRSCFKEKFAIPRQPQLAPAARGVLELLPPFDGGEAVEGLEQVSHVWLLFLFHQALEDKPRLKVRPPRLGGNRSLGVFATRATHRPNGIGQSVVRLEKVEPGRLWLSGIDLLDGTPVLDIKPYVPYADAVADARNAIAEAPPAPIPVQWSDTALAQALDVPLRERNELLTAAGYAPLYPDQALDAPAMNSINKALQRMLRQHEPFPAIVLDRYWNVLMANDAAPRLFNCFVDLDARPTPRNLLHLMFDPKGLRPFVVNWPETARGLLGRLSREALGHVIDEKTRALLAELSHYPGVKAEWRAPSPGGVMPMIPLCFAKDGVRLNYFSMITTVGTPQTVTAEELRLECMFPADDATESGHSRFIAAHSPRGAARH